MSGENKTVTTMLRHTLPADPARRQWLCGMGKSATLASALPLLSGIGSSLLSQNTSATASGTSAPEVLKGTEFHLNIGYRDINISGSKRRATLINGSLPGPTLHWKEGDEVTLHVTNHLDTASSIHWHGLILPTDMDGVPGLSFDGIPPGETFTYRFTVSQTGTYWYHSHSGFQEQTGVYGSIVIDGKSDPVTADADHVIVLSDWSDQTPESIYATLKKMSHYYNRQERTLRDTFRDIQEKGFVSMWRDRAMWNDMRMSSTDISDVTGYTYHYLLNGKPSTDTWRTTFTPGQTLRLRFINAGAMTLFDVRIPGLPMTVVAADGQPVKPVSVDEFRIGTAETYDVLITPTEAAYTLFAQSIDRSGFIWGTLASQPNAAAEVPAVDPPPVLEHGDMGMGHGDHSAHGSNSSEHSGHDMGGMEGMDHSGHDMGGMADMDGMDHSSHDMSGMGGMDHSGHDMSSMENMDHSGHGATTLDLAGMGSTAAIVHKPSEFGPQVDMRSEVPVSGLDDPGIGLRHHQHRFGRKVLSYADLKNYYPTGDKRQPTREIQLHLTGNMSRYTWSFDGIKYTQAEPVKLTYGERVRITLVNDTMMTHPIHLHGLWSELETGDPDFIPRKHTILVQPGKKISYLVTADAEGRWAYHCHLLYHMSGMMREVRVERA